MRARAILFLVILPVLVLAQTAPDLPKAKRYLELGMFPEARTALESALKEGEFDGQLRYLYGKALTGLRAYEEAIRQLTIATKLDATDYLIWDQLLTAYDLKLETSPTNEDRSAAYVAAAQLRFLTGVNLNLNRLAVVRGDEPLFTDDAGMTAARARAQSLIDQLDSPVGYWGSGEQKYRIQVQNGDMWLSKESIGGLGSYSLRIVQTQAFTFEGSGLFGQGPCFFEGRVTLKASRAAVHLDLQSVPARLRGVDPRISTDSEVLKIIRTTICEKGFEPYSESLERLR